MGITEMRTVLRHSYSRFGIRSAMPATPAMMFLWEIMTPLGMPVEPLVYMITAISLGRGCLRCTITGKREEEGKEREIKIECLISRVLVSGQNFKYFKFLIASTEYHVERNIFLNKVPKKSNWVVGDLKALLFSGFAPSSWTEGMLWTKMPLGRPGQLVGLWSTMTMCCSLGTSSRISWGYGQCRGARFFKIHLQFHHTNDCKTVLEFSILLFF